eukprot:759529-Hanusia_phi.AAC.8
MSAGSSHGPAPWFGLSVRGVVPTNRTTTPYYGGGATTQTTFRRRCHVATAIAPWALILSERRVGDKGCYSLLWDRGEHLPCLEDTPCYDRRAIRRTYLAVGG